MSTIRIEQPQKRSIPYTPQFEAWSEPLHDFALDPAFEKLHVTAPDDVRLFVQAAGPKDAPAIVFIHGFSQSHLSWRRQFSDPALTNSFRLIAYDLRGHGLSDKPEDRARYRDDKVWADDLKAVIEATGATRPVLVAWSYAGRVVSDYVKAYGQDDMAGINYVAAVTKSDKRFWGPALRHTGEMLGDDFLSTIRASRKFVRACFAVRPIGDELDITLAYTMMATPNSRALVVDRTRNEGDVLAQLRVPVLVTHGNLDRIILPVAGEHTASAVPNARLSMYGGIGHSPFFEDPQRFNRELAEFVRATNT
jgi:non-heme chloroperoxidase